MRRAWNHEWRQIPKIIGLVCKRALQKRPIFSKESHVIICQWCVHGRVFLYGTNVCVHACMYIYMGWLRLVGSIQL